MTALTLLFGWLVLAAGPSSTAAPPGYLPGKAVELHDLGRSAPLARPRVPSHRLQFP